MIEKHKMKKKIILLVFGTRPEAIKMAPICNTIMADEEFNLLICVTGQHREMLDQVLKVFDLKPDIDLNLMKKNQDLVDITTLAILGVRNVLKEYKPDIVLVHGDTTTTMATSMACFYEGVAVGHVEAGLRTHNINSPFPEEFNRRVASVVAKFHFAPTFLSKKNLLNENINDSNIFITGNTVVDSLFWVLNKIDSTPSIYLYVTKLLNKYLPFDWMNSRYILVTGHRRENFGSGFLSICEAITEIATKYPSVHFVYPVHLNPNVQKPVKDLLSDFHNVHLIPPLEYEPFVYLLKKCYLVLTDSGGIQEEAPSLGKPVLVMRDITERPEAVESGTVLLVGTDKNKIVSNLENILTNSDYYQSMSQAYNPYGDGKASEKIIKHIKDKLNDW